MKECKDIEVKVLLETVSKVPNVLKAWMYRGQLYMAVKPKCVDSVAKCFNVSLVNVTDELNTVPILRTVWKTDEASAKQEESRNAFSTYNLVQAHYEKLVKYLSDRNEPDLKVDTEDSERSEELQDEYDRFNPSDLSMPEGYVGHIYRDEY